MWIHSASLAVRIPMRAVTDHAATRMQQRAVRPEHVAAALKYGRRIHSKGLTYYVIGRKEVLRHAERGIDLAPAEGVQVLVSVDGAVVTVYRNRDLHAIKETRRSRRHERAAKH